MNFKQFLIEQDQIDYNQHAKQLAQAANQIANKCRPFLESINPSQASDIKDNILYRGLNERLTYDVKEVRKKRQPVDMPKPIHKFLDQWFFERFGVYARSNGLFVTTNVNQAQSYGMAHYTFPEGQFTIISSHKVRDLFDRINQFIKFDDRSTFSFQVDDLRDIPNNYKLSNKAQKQLLELLDDAEYKKMNVANLGRDNEAVVLCDKYHVVAPPLNSYVDQFFFDQLGKNL